MTPQTRRRKPRNSSKVNLLISFIFHSLIILAGFYFAARGGLLGKQLKKIAVEMVKEKPPERPKERPKAEPPKTITPQETPKPQPVRMAEAPKPSVPPPDVSAPPAVAPPAAELPAFEFAGGKTVETSANPVEIYKGLLEYAFRSKWNKPEDIADDQYVAEVQVSVDRDGQIDSPRWLKGSGNPPWDESVRRAIAAVSALDHPPPTDFPPTVVVRFDVQEQAESVFR